MLLAQQTDSKVPARRKLSASLEDYLEAIFHIVARKQAARAKDIAERVGVNRSSVTGALRMLSDKGLVNYAPYDVITLTEPGRVAAEDVVNRHSALSRFLERVLGVEAGEAERAACGMEHAIPRSVMEQLVSFADFVQTCPRAGADWIEAFMAHCGPDPAGQTCDQCLSQCVGQWQQRKDEQTG